MSDKTDKPTKTEPAEEAPTLPPGIDPGVVGIRRVVMRPMSRVEQQDIAAKNDGKAEPPASGPKPQPQNEFIPKLSQMKRTHTRPGNEKKPFYMSELKP